MYNIQTARSCILVQGGSNPLPKNVIFNYKNIRGLPKNLSKNPLTNLVANEDKIEETCKTM